MKACTPCKEIGVFFAVFILFNAIMRFHIILRVFAHRVGLTADLTLKSRLLGNREQKLHFFFCRWLDSIHRVASSKPLILDLPESVVGQKVMLTDTGKGCRKPRDSSDLFSGIVESWDDRCSDYNLALTALGNASCVFKYALIWRTGVFLMLLGIYMLDIHKIEIKIRQEHFYSVI